MGNLVLPDGIGNMTKGIISCWFRVPAASLAAANVNNSTGDWFVLGRVLPLITWGPQYTGSRSDWSFPSKDVAYGSGPVNHLVKSLYYPSGNHSVTTPPSYIGIQCFGAGTIEVNLQTSSAISCAGVQEQFTDFSVAENTPSAGNITVTYTKADASSAYQGAYDYYGNAGYGDAGQKGFFDTGWSYQTLPPMGATDKWHHILLSWDITSGCVVNGNGRIFAIDPTVSKLADLTVTSSKLWFAYDDVNKSGTNLPGTWLGTDNVGSGNPDVDVNAVVSGYCSAIINHQFTIRTPHTLVNDDEAVPTPTYYNFGTPAIASGGSIASGPLTIPGPISLTEYAGTTNGQVEMGELQIYAGKTLDTSILANRRLFVTTDGKPEKMAVSAAALGKTPEVYLGGSSSNWTSGRNQGTAGNFTRNGTLTPYTPGPSLR